MENKQNIEDQINAALQSAKNIQQADLPYGFSERVANKLHEQNNVRWLYTVSPLLRVAAVFIILIINMFTIKLALGPQPAQTPAQYVTTVKDFVNDYQINDASEELLTTNTPAHE